MRKCLTCGEKTRNPKYCSRSCSATANNMVSPRRKKTKKCLLCDTKIFCSRMYCSEHRYHKKDFTLREAIYEKHHHSSAYALVRSRARLEHKKIMTKCERCGYNKHVEVCHIIPISDFSLDTKISKINERKNIIILCPNCHWEFDNKKNRKANMAS